MLNEEVAKMIAQLRSHKFDVIGSLYFISALATGAGERKIVPMTENGSRVPAEIAIENRTTVSDRLQGNTLTEESRGHRADQTTLQTSLPAKNDGTAVALNAESADEFAIGHMFDQIFFDETRVFLPTNRGPFKNSLQWLQAAVEVQLEYFNKGLFVLALRAEGEETEYDSYLEEEAPGMEDTCQLMLEILPEVFNDKEEGAQYVIHHHDLNAYNILVNPETFEVTGLPNWEMPCVVPEWKATIEPKFLDYIVFSWEEDEDEPPIPPSLDEEGEHQFAIEKGDRWDYKLLKRHFTATLKKILGEAGNPDHSDPGVTKTKQEFQSNIWYLTGDCSWTRRFLKK